MLLTGAEKEELGILVFDVTSAPASFIAEENADLLAKFLKVTATPTPSGTPATWRRCWPTIAKDAGMDEDATKPRPWHLRVPDRRRTSLVQVAGWRRRSRS